MHFFRRSHWEGLPGRSDRRSLKWRAVGRQERYLGGFYVPPRPSRPPHREAKVEAKSTASAAATIAPVVRYALSSTPYIDFDRKSNSIKDLLDNTLAHLPSEL
jgi:hypothetical protein